MNPLATVGPPLGLQETSADMSPEQRCSVGIRNIELLCDLDWRGRLLLGAELSRMKWSGDFTRDDDVWRPDETARGWDEWLKRRDFRLEGGEKAMSQETANTLIMWSVLYANFVAVNEQRAEQGLLPLPLPTSVSQLRPYQTMMRRVDDWQPPELNQPGAPTAAFELQPPFAESQPEVIAAWEEAFQSIPPEKRMRKGELRPPTRTESEDYLRKKEGLKQLKAREEREIEKAKQAALTVGEKAADPARQAAAAAPPPRAKARPKTAPKKSAEELAAEQRAYQIQQDVRAYRLKMNNLQESAQALEAFVKNTLARERSESYLRELRQQQMGIYSVTDDVAKLRDAVVVCQSIYKLITEPYAPPEPISRYEVDPQTTTVDI